MKKLWTVLLAAALLIACTDIQPVPAAEPTPQADAVATAAPAQPTPEAERRDAFAGCYENGGFDTVIISKIGDEYLLAASLYRLIVIEHAPGAVDGDRLVFRTEGEDQPKMTLSFYRDGDTYTLRAEQSEWDVIEAGTAFEGFVRTADEAMTDGAYAEPVETPKPQGHYVFQPKVCSAYLKEVFGSEMCNAWFSLVDAVLAGADTFACPDQHTYDWVMGQFPERCLPILPDLIDYAYDREHSVKDGVGQFTYIVSPEQARARIAEFGAQIEGILNDALADGYSDFEKCYALYTYFTTHYEYDYETYDRMYREYDLEISSRRFFRTGMGVCQEISTAYSYLLMQAGVEATTMSGNAHQWSYVRINGKNYHIDPTFGMTERGSLAYFLMTDEQREASGFPRQNFVIASNYSQDNPHPDYVADDDHFRPLWDAYCDETLSHETHTAVCPIGEDENGEWQYLEFDYAGY